MICVIWSVGVLPVAAARYGKGMQSALLLVAHGSRIEQSNDEIRRLTVSLREAAGARFGAVDCAFLELAEPSIPDGIQRLIEVGARHITVLPYFLAAGRHVSEHIPAEVDGKRQQHPAVAIEIAPYFGAAAGIPDLLLSLASLPRHNR